MVTIKPEFNLTLLERKRRFGDELYGIDAYLEAETEEERQLVRDMIIDQETRHIIEGLELMQRESRDFVFDGWYVVNPYTGAPMRESAALAVEVTRGQGKDLETRMKHDLAAEDAANGLMRYGEIGDGFWRVLPFAHELSPKEARAIGMNPECQTSYLHLFRKADHDHIEVSILRLDFCGLSSHRGLLRDNGAVVDECAPSYELSGLHIPCTGLYNQDERSRFIDRLLCGYRHHYTIGTLPLADNALEFMASHSSFLEDFAQMQIDFANCLKRGVPSQQLRTEAYDALVFAVEFGMDEKHLLAELAGGCEPNRARHESALRLLVNLRRYGIWAYLRGELRGERMDNTATTLKVLIRRTALRGEIMPGCPGGFGPETMYRSIWSDEWWYGAFKTRGRCTNCTRDTIVGEQSWCRDCITGLGGC